MAPPRKRYSRDTPDEDDERNGDYAESSLSPAKRVKLERLNRANRRSDSDELDMDMRAEEDEEDGSDDDMDEDDDDDDDVEAYDDGDDDTEDEEADYKAYFEQKEKDRAKGMLGLASESGALKRIVLVDFMCHRHLKVDFAPRMNFLVGHNGSGKSAILTAFAVVMGGKTSLTGRGSGLKALIRNGADKAIITATITNKGWEAFKPDVYGDQIIIERTITKTGGTFKMRGSLAGNKVISTKKDELMQMLSLFDLSIDSPLTILTQDKAKVFLAQADEVQLYRFFLEGTGLAALSQEYERASGTWVEVQRHVRKMLEGIPMLKDRLEKVLKKMGTASRIEQQKEKAIRIKQELGWAYVQLKETQLHEAIKKATDSKGKLELTVANLEKSEEDKRKLDEDFTTVNNEVEEMKDAEKPLSQDRKAKASALRAGLKEKDEMQDQLNDLRTRMDDHDKTVADLNRKIDAKKREMGDGGLTAQQRADEARLMELEAQRNKLQPQVGLKEQAIRDKEAQVAQLEEKIEEANGRCMESNREARDLESGLERMQRQTENRLSVFGNNIEVVMRAIDRAQWYVRPVGPLGMFVELQDMNYRDVLHSYLGAQLCTWAVQDQRDRAQLMAILKKAADQGGYRPASAQRIPNVILNSGELFDFSAGDLSGFGHTIISKLAVSDPYVLRCLVNSAGIERTFLAPSNHAANSEVDRLGARAGEHRSLQREIKVLSADKFEHTGRGKAKNVGPIGDWRGPPLFTRNLAADIENMRARAAEKRSVEAHHKQEQRALVQRRDALKSEIYRENEALAKLNLNLPKFDAQIEDLKDRLAQNPSDEIGGLQSYKREELNKKAAIEAQYMALEQTINNTIMPDLERMKAEAEEAKRKHEDYTPALMRKRDALTEIAKLRDKERTTTKHWASRKIRYEDEHRADRAAVERHEKELAEWISKAKQFHAERIHTRRSIEELKSEREAVNKTVAEAEQREGINIEDLVLTKENLEKEIGELRETASSLSEVVKIGEMAISTRKEWWRSERSRLAFGVRCEFVGNCAKRNMIGRFHFDHQAALGDIRVRTMGNAAEGTLGEDDDRHYKTIKSLSGGEKSFVTVSLLLALWQAVSGPIKCLDEWDVFLDDVNRAVAAKMLLEGAKTDFQKQFILITPQSMQNAASHIGAEDRIIKMADPIRNQGTLDMSAR